MMYWVWWLQRLAVKNMHHEVIGYTVPTERFAEWHPDMTTADGW